MEVLARCIRHSSFVILLSAFIVLPSAFCTGCSSPSSVLQTDKSHPSLEIDGNQVRCNGVTVSPYDVPKILEEHGVSHNTLIHIRVKEQRYTREAHLFRHVLARGGYSHSTLVTKEHAEAWSQESNRAAARKLQQKPRIRYRSAYE